MNPNKDNTPSGETVRSILEACATPDTHIIELEANIESAEHSLRQAIEGIVERVIGEDEEVSFSSVGTSMYDAGRNQLRTEQRLRAKEELSKLFGEG